MNLLLAFVIGQAISPAEASRVRVDADAAIRIAKESAVALGIPQPSLDDIALMRNNLNGPIPFWGVGFVAPDQRKGSVLVDSTDGRVVYASFMPPAWTRSSPETLKLSEVEKLARQFVGVVGHEKSLKLDSCDVDQEGLAHATFDILVKGKRFFNVNPAFRYNLLFYPRQKSIYVFTSYDRLPPVSSKPITLTKQKAAEILKSYIPTSLEYKNLSKPNGNLGEPSFSLDLELGYYMLKGDGTAHNVWYGKAIVYRPTPNLRLEVGTIQRVIDAETGQIFPIQDNDAVVTP